MFSDLYLSIRIINDIEKTAKTLSKIKNLCIIPGGDVL